MSFAGKVKKELLGQMGKARHCQLAELAAFFAVCGQIYMNEEGECQVKFVTENLTVAKKCYMLVKRVFHIVPDVSVSGHHQYSLFLLEDEDARDFMKAIRVQEYSPFSVECIGQKACCNRAFLRGVFLTSGSVTDPNSGYHLEIAAGDREHAARILEIMGIFGIEAKTIERKHNFVVYMKEGAAIVDFLNVVGAHKALMEFENVSAAARQTEDIRYIHDTIGFGNLSENLSQIAKLRLENPDVSLKELGQMLEPPIGKSGVNHRLRTLSEIAQGLRLQGGKHDKEEH